MSRRPARRTVRRKSAKRSNKKFLRIFTIAALLLLFGAGIYHYREGLAYYLGFKIHRTKRLTKAEEKRIRDVRHFTILDKYSDFVAGCDVSQYQGEIDWKQVRFVEGRFPLRFVFIRATAGKNLIDACFEANWKGAGKAGLIRGAYHYYRPNENSLAQADLFIKTVKLRKGDLPPVLDIERLPRNQPLDSLKKGLRRWLEKVDAHYKVRPIIYTGEKYYDAFLKDEFSDYTFWIANYNFFVEDMKDDWLFWQFTERAVIPGIPFQADLSVYNGTPKQLGYLRIN